MDIVDKPPRCSLIREVRHQPVAVLANEHQCELGQWLDHQGCTVATGLMDLHGRMHRVAVAVVSLYGVGHAADTLDSMQHFDRMWRELHRRLGIDDE